MHKVKFPDHEYKMQQYTGNTMGSKSKIPGYISPFIKFPDFALKFSKKNSNSPIFPELELYFNFPCLSEPWAAEVWSSDIIQYKIVWQDWIAVYLQYETALTYIYVVSIELNN